MNRLTWQVLSLLGISSCMDCCIDTDKTKEEYAVTDEFQFSDTEQATNCSLLDFAPVQVTNERNKHISNLTESVWKRIWRKVSKEKTPTFVYQNKSTTFLHAWEDQETFVDKSKFIEYFLKIIKGQPRVILAPRRFGKTCNLDMVRYFFQIPVDGNGNVVNEATESKKSLFKGLKVCITNPSFCEEVSSRPVIFADFVRIKVDTLQEYKESLRRLVRRAFVDHAYLLNSTRLEDFEKDLILDFIKKDLPLSAYEEALNELSTLLQKHFLKTCIVLVDEIDSPANSLACGLNVDGNTNSIITSLATFLKLTVKDNADVEIGFLTGIMRIGNVYTRGANNLQYMSIFDNPMIAQHYGFTDDNVDVLFDTNRPSDKISRLRDVKSYYDGYFVQGSKKKLFNTQSVKLYMQSGELKPYWAAAPGIFKLRSMFEYSAMGSFIEKSLTTEVRVSLKDIITIDDFEILTKIINPRSRKYTIGPSEKNLFMQILFENGYYTCPEPIKVNPRSAILIVPNEEIRFDLQKLLYDRQWYHDKYQLVGNELHEYNDCLLNLDETRESFYRLMLFLEKFFRIPGNLYPRKEFNFHSPLYTIPKFLFNEDYVVVQAEGTVNRINETDTEFDLLIYRRDGTRIILEFKLGRTNKGSGFIALRQIVRKKYYLWKTGKDAKNQIYAGVLVNKKGEWKISYLHNSIDLKNAINITSIPETFIQKFAQ